MEFDVEQADHLLSTTRAVRKRLDFERDVSDQILLDCINLAEQAPTGGNQQSRKWMVVRDPAKKAALADIYRAAGGTELIEIGDKLDGTGHKNESMMSSAAYLARNLQKAPVIVIPTIQGVHDGSGRPGLFDSGLQAAWSFCLALRARGLGTAWTTVHLRRKEAVEELLAIPEDVTQLALFPVAWTIGTDFGRGPRRPASELTYLDTWGDRILTG